MVHTYGTIGWYNTYVELSVRYLERSLYVPLGTIVNDLDLIHSSCSLSLSTAVWYHDVPSVGMPGS